MAEIRRGHTIPGGFSVLAWDGSGEAQLRAFAPERRITVRGDVALVERADGGTQELAPGGRLIRLDAGPLIISTDPGGWPAGELDEA